MDDLGLGDQPVVPPAESGIGTAMVIDLAACALLLCAAMRRRSSPLTLSFIEASSFAISDPSTSPSASPSASPSPSLSSCWPAPLETAVTCRVIPWSLCSMLSSTASTASTAKVPMISIVRSALYMHEL